MSAIAAHLPGTLRLLRGRRQWTVLALLVGVGLLAYYGTLAVGYWRASQQIDSAEARIPVLSAQIREPLPDVEVLRQDLTSRQAELAELRQVFSYQEAADIMAVVGQVARDSSVHLTSMAAGTSRSESQGSTRYQVQPVSITLIGKVVDIHGFLSLLQERARVARVDNISVTNLAGQASARLQLMFDLSPEVGGDADGD